MLVLTRNPNEKIFIGDGIEVTVLSVTGNKVRLGIVAPKDIPIHRDDAKVRSRHCECRTQFASKCGKIRCPSCRDRG